MMMGSYTFLQILLCSYGLQNIYWMPNEKCQCLLGLTTSYILIDRCCEFYDFPSAVLLTETNYEELLKLYAERIHLKQSCV